MVSGVIVNYFLLSFSSVFPIISTEASTGFFSKRFFRDLLLRFLPEFRSLIFFICLKDFLLKFVPRVTLEISTAVPADVSDRIFYEVSSCDFPGLFLGFFYNFWRRSCWDISNMFFKHSHQSVALDLYRMSSRDSSWPACQAFC